MKAVISLKINILILNESQQKIIDILNTDFAEEYVLWTKTKMKLECSRPYNDLYEFLKVEYNLFEEMVDELAERL